MTIRHKARKESLEMGKSSEWNDDHHIDFENEIMQIWTFSSVNIPSEFTTLTTGSATINTEMSEYHNFLTIKTGTTSGSIGSLILGNRNVTNRRDLPILTIALKLEKKDQVEFGFFDYSTTPFTSNQKGAYFRISGGKVYSVTGDGTNETVTELGNANTYDQYRIEFTSTDIRFYITNLYSIKATHATNITNDDITIKISAKTYLGNEQIIRVDGIGLKRLRKR